METDVLPLKGIKVLDLTRLLPGPMCTLTLADLGAEVLKVEDTDLGDYARLIPPMAKTMSHVFLTLNRNKKSLSLNLRDPLGQKIFHELVPSYDVLVESFRPGVTEKLGIDYAALKALNPRLVYCSLTGHGQTGPLKERAGHDINYLSLAGLLDQMGNQNGPPLIPAFQIADLAGGAQTASIAILAALYRQKSLNQGSYLDISMLDGTFSLLSVPFSTRKQRPAPARGTDMLSGGTPCYDLFPTSDGRYMSLGALEKKFWDLFCRTLGREDLIPFHMAKGKKGEEVKAILNQIFSDHPQSYWIEKFSSVDCCCTPLLTLEEALVHPQIEARGLTQEAHHPTEGPLTYLCSPFKFDGVSSRPGRPAPLQGEQTRDILRELGYGEEFIEDCLAKKIVKSPGKAIKE